MTTPPVLIAGAGAGQERHLAEAHEKGARMRVRLVMTLLLPITGSAFAADQAQPDRGREVYQKWCTPCHGTGLGKPGTSAAAAHGLNPAVL